VQVSVAAQALDLAPADLTACVAWATVVAPDKD
jgi:hypothetical protein